MKIRSNNKNLITSFLVVLLISLIYNYQDDIKTYLNIGETYSYTLSSIPEFDGRYYIEINNNIPNFDDELKTTISFETYGELDSLGRCTEAFANVSLDTMPDGERKSIGSIKPTGWQTVKYDFIDGKYLYNRCHLIGYQLTAENANKKNLITCTRHMNADTMLKFENKVASYIKNTGNHVLYRVVPIFDKDNLLAKGVTMEAYSVEDNGEGISFNVFVYNVEPGVEIDYKTGESKLKDETN